MTIQNKSLLKEIDRHDWYQSIPLEGDIVTPGETGDAEMRKMEMMELPDDLSGLSVLDVGSNEGFFSFQAERRNAKRVVAIDKSSAAREKFELVKSILGSKAEFMALNLHELDPKKSGRFDIVFFLSVFHHLRYPMLALDQLFKLTGKFAVMEFVEAVPETYSDQSVLVRKLSKKGHLHILPTRQFTLEILERAGYTKIEILGTHRAHAVGADRKMPGFTERRVLLKAHV